MTFQLLIEDLDLYTSRKIISLLTLAEDYSSAYPDYKKNTDRVVGQPVFSMYHFQKWYWYPHEAVKRAEI